MTSFRQFEANRRNAERSTGPKTEEGKRRSRRNALRHGLCAETVIEIVEDVEDYKEFESAIIANYEAETGRGTRIGAQIGFTPLAHPARDLDRH